MQKARRRAPEPVAVARIFDYDARNIYPKNGSEKPTSANEQQIIFRNFGSGKKINSGK
jgi:hypothetical protein